MGVKRGEAPSKNYLPSPLVKGRGIKGEGLLNNLRLTRYCGRNIMRRRVVDVKILIVEDNEDSRNLLIKQLRPYGHEVTAGANGV